jgi:hypothetical protein
MEPTGRGDEPHGAAPRWPAAPACRRRASRAGCAAPSRRGFPCVSLPRSEGVDGVHAQQPGAARRRLEKAPVAFVDDHRTDRSAGRRRLSTRTYSRTVQRFKFCASAKPQVPQGCRGAKSVFRSSTGDLADIAQFQPRLQAPGRVPVHQFGEGAAARDPGDAVAGGHHDGRIGRRGTGRRRAGQEVGAVVGVQPGERGVSRPAPAQLPASAASRPRRRVLLAFWKVLRPPWLVSTTSSSEVLAWNSAAFTRQLRTGSALTPIS